MTEMYEDNTSTDVLTCGYAGLGVDYGKLYSCLFLTEKQKMKNIF
jgi:hypothetical protein